MAEPPTTGWTSRADGETGVEAAPFPGRWAITGSIHHVFTHFELVLDIYRAQDVSCEAPEGWWWSKRDELPGEALPSVMKKAIEAAIPGATGQPHPRKEPE